MTNGGHSPQSIDWTRSIFLIYSFQWEPAKQLLQFGVLYFVKEKSNNNRIITVKWQQEQRRWECWRRTDTRNRCTFGLTLFLFHLCIRYCHTSREKEMQRKCKRNNFRFGQKSNECGQINENIKRNTCLWLNKEAGKAYTRTIRKKKTVFLKQQLFAYNCRIASNKLLLFFWGLMNVCSQLFEFILKKTMHRHTWVTRSTGLKRMWQKEGERENKEPE